VGSHVVDASVGDDFSLVLTASGRVYAFGANSTGELGTSFNEGTGKPNPTPRQVVLPGLKGHAIEVAAGYEHSLVLTSTGQVYGFGLNFSGELGTSINTGTSKPNPKPRQIKLPGASGRVVRIVAGYENSFAVTSAGELYAWGDSQWGELGTGSTNYTNPTPARVFINGSATNVSSVSTGSAHTLVVTKSGALYAFGDNLNGQLGTAKNDNMNSANLPARVALPAGSGTVIQASAGEEHSLVLTRTGAVYAFGANTGGELCNSINLGESTASNPTPTRVSLAHTRGRVVGVVASYDYSLVRSSAGSVYGCGDDSEQQLGAPVPKGYDYVRLTTARLGSGTTIDAVTSGFGSDHTLAIVADLAIANGSLSRGSRGRSYKTTLHARGGMRAYKWSAIGLPKGLRLSGRTGRLHGTPTKAGRYLVTIAVTDADGVTATRHLRLVITS
jgi:alpha-tubulin suppressor-like RCC1 family protein